MALIKEKCPLCGGTVIIPDKMNAGECDSCGTQYSLSELQRRKEEASSGFRDEKSPSDGYQAALSTDNIFQEDVNELCKKAQTALESEQWQKVYQYCNEIIRRDPKYAKAYLYKLLADFKIFRKEELASCPSPFGENENYRLLCRFADNLLATEIKNYCETASAKHDEQSKETRYRSLCARMNGASDPSQLRDIANGFLALKGYKDSSERYKQCLGKSKRSALLKIGFKAALIVVPILIVLGIIIAIVGAVNAKNAEYDLHHFEIKITDKTNDEYNSDYIWCKFDYVVVNNSPHEIKKLTGYMTIKDGDGNTLSNGEVNLDGNMLSRAETNWNMRWRMQRDKDSAEIWNSDYEELVILFRITYIYFADGTSRYYDSEDVTVKEYNSSYAEDKYSTALSHYHNGRYTQAKELFEELGSYKDSAAMAQACEEKIYEAENQPTYNVALSHYNSGRYEEAKELFEELGSYKDSAAMAQACEQKLYEIDRQAKEAKYQAATAKLESGDYLGAVGLFMEIEGYKDSDATVDLIYESAYDIAYAYSVAGKYQEAVELLEGLGYTDQKGDGTPDNIYRAIQANKAAMDGDYFYLVTNIKLTDFVIPDGVTAISGGAFAMCTTLTSVVIPDSVTSIGNQAFYGCTALTEITLPDSVTSVGDQAFYGCTALAEITLPDSVTTVGSGAFHSCTSLEEITLSANLTVLGSQALTSCTKLSEITLPDKLSVIGAQAFSYCSGIRKLVIPDSVTVIGDKAFDRCNKLAELSMPAIADFELSKMFSVSVPQSLIRVNITSGTRLGDRFFRSCTTLEEINLPDGLELIGEGAFAHCRAQRINIPDSVVQIKAEAFAYSTIESFTLPAGVTVVSSSLFAHSELKKLTLHGNVTSIESSAFNDCSVTITYDGTKDEWLAMERDSLWDIGMSTYKVICHDSTFTHMYYQDSWS